MYAEQLVQQWIDEKRQYVSENEVRSHGLLGKLAIVILEENYEGRYEPPMDNHFCGGYYFKNPLGHYKKVYELYYMFPKMKLEKLGNYSNYDNAVEEIVRLEYDDIYWHHKEQIPEYINAIKLEMSNDMYYNTRYWFIWEGKIWTI